MSQSLMEGRCAQILSVTVSVALHVTGILMESRILTSCGEDRRSDTCRWLVLPMSAAISRLCFWRILPDVSAVNCHG